MHLRNEHVGHLLWNLTIGTNKLHDTMECQYHINKLVKIATSLFAVASINFTIKSF